MLPGQPRESRKFATPGLGQHTVHLSRLNGLSRIWLTGKRAMVAAGVVAAEIGMMELWAGAPVPLADLFGF